jgi:hypothetical protein
VKNRNRLLTQTLTAIALVALGSTACSHASRIVTVPSGAKVKVDGKVIGKSPVIYQERSSYPFRRKRIEVELKGYGKRVYEEKVRVCSTPGNLIMDSLVVGWFFGFCLADRYTFDFTQPQKKKVSRKKKALPGEKAPRKPRS